MAGSLLAHAGLLFASAASPPAEAAAAPSRPHHPTGAFLVQADLFQPSCFSWPPPEAVQSCFDRATLDAQGFATSHLRSYGHEVEPQRSWTRYPSPEGPSPPDEELAGEILRGDLRECARVAMGAGWSGDGRVFVRVTREAAGSALVQALPLDDAAKDPGLLCCVREAQNALLRSMSPGQTERYVLRGGEDVTLTRPPQ